MHLTGLKQILLFLRMSSTASSQKPVGIVRSMFYAKLKCSYFPGTLLFLYLPCVSVRLLVVSNRSRHWLLKQKRCDNPQKCWLGGLETKAQGGAWHNVKNHGADGLLIWSYQRLEEPAVATATSAPVSEKLHLGLCAHTAPSGTASLIGISDG